MVGAASGICPRIGREDTTDRPGKRRNRGQFAVTSGVSPSGRSWRGRRPRRPHPRSTVRSTVGPSRAESAPAPSNAARSSSVMPPSGPTTSTTSPVAGSRIDAIRSDAASCSTIAVPPAPTAARTRAATSAVVASGSHLGHERPTRLLGRLARGRCATSPRRARPSRRVHSATDRDADHGTTTSTPTSVSSSTESSPRSPLASAWTTTTRGDGGACSTYGDDARRRAGRARRPRSPSPSTTRPRPSPTSTVLTDREPLTVAACRPSAPSRTTTAPASRGTPASTRKNGAVTGSAAVEGVAQPREQAALLDRGRPGPPWWSAAPRRAARRARAAAPPAAGRAWSASRRRRARAGRRGRTPRRCATPFCRSVTVWPDCVPGLMSIRSRPSSVSRSMAVPSAAAVIGSVTVQCRSSPCAEKTSCGVSTTSRKRSPGGPPPGPTSPSPASWIRVPVSTPGGHLDGDGATGAHAAVAGALGARVRDERAEALALRAGRARS